MDIVFSQFKSYKKGNDILVKSDFERTGLEKFGIVAGIWIVVSIILILLNWALLFIVLKLNMNFPIPPYFAFNFGIFLGAIVTGFLYLQYNVDFLGVGLLKFNSEKDTFNSEVDHFHTQISHIRRITITEKEYENNGEEYKVYQLKLSLNDGEKTLPFASTSYNTMEDLIKIIPLKNSS